MKHLSWIFFNLYGYIFGWRFLAPVHHAVVNLSLHALGYDNAYRERWTGEEWFLKNVVAPYGPRVCLDIGANVGNYSRMLLEHTQARIYAIEPSKSSFESLEILRNPRLVAIKAAVADRVGEGIIHSQGERDVKASLDANVREGIGEKVPVVTIESLAQEHGITEIDFIKIDTEGYEREVLRGLGRHRPRFIQFEFNLHHLYRSCTVFELSGLLKGYDLYRLLPRGMVRIDPRKFIDNIFMFCNIVALRQD